MFAGGGGGGIGGLGGIGGGGAGGPGNNSGGLPGLPASGGGGGGSAGRQGGDGGSGIVLIRFMAATYVEVIGDVMLNFGDQLARAGEWPGSVIDSNSRIAWNSFVNQGEFHKITVALRDGAIPNGMRLKVFCERAAADVVLSGNTQSLVTGIGNESVSLPLRYTLEVIDAAAVCKLLEPLIIEYTIGSQ